MKKIIILYIPVIHEGYIKFLKKHRDADILYVLGEELIEKFTDTTKEIRQVNPRIIKNLIESGGLFKKAEVLTYKKIKKLQGLHIITANEEISLKIINEYFPDSKATMDSVFLRWDKKNINTKKPVEYDRISNDPFDRKIMKIIMKEAEKSTCWWRHVGAALVKEKKIIITAHSKHMPSEHTPYSIGDPRDFVEAGKSSDITTVIHGEQQIIAKSARKKGVGMEGASLYITDFPCPMCAKELAHTGIKKCFFKKGHASLNGVEDLKTAKIELVLVK